MTDVRFAYSVGETVECHDIRGPAPIAYQPARVVALTPFQGRPGYYLEWSHSGEFAGWFPETSIRRPAPGRKV